MRTILPQIIAERAAGRDCVLVSLIADTGSAPRGKGSLMLVGAQGRIAGTVGGGAIERHCENMGKTLTAEKRSGIHEFILRANKTEDIGMICGGDVTAQFQFIPAESPLWDEVLHLAQARMAAHRHGWLILREDGGTPTLAADGQCLAGENLSAETLQTLCRKQCARADGRFSLPLPTGDRVIIFGAGHVAQSLCPVLRSVDFSPVIYDPRAELLTRELFPDAQGMICDDFTRISDHLTITADDYVVVMTHGHIHDYTVEEHALRGEFAYLGVIGSRRKIAAVNERLLKSGLPPERLNDVHTPIGLNIKAVTPAEIAISIAGEMILVRATLREEAGGSAARGCPMHGQNA